MAVYVCVCLFPLRCGQYDKNENVKIVMLSAPPGDHSVNRFKRIFMETLKKLTPASHIPVLFCFNYKYTAKHLDFPGNSILSFCPLASAVSFPISLLSLPTHPLLLSSLSLLQACNTKYPDYDKTGSICVSEHINNTLTRYRWLISAPAGPDGVTSPMREVDFDTFFTSSKMITLDSIYFQAGSRVQCAARAVNSNGDEGLELSSPIVTISQEEGENRTMNSRFNVLCCQFSRGGIKQSFDLLLQ